MHRQLLQVKPETACKWPRPVNGTPQETGTVKGQRKRVSLGQLGLLLPRQCLGKMSNVGSWLECAFELAHYIAGRMERYRLMNLSLLTPIIYLYAINNKLDGKIKSR